MTAHVFSVADSLYYPPDRVLHARENSEERERSLEIAPMSAGAKKVKKEDASLFSSTKYLKAFLLK